MNIRTILLTSVAAGALAITVGACTHSGDDGIPQSQLDAETEAKEAAEKKAAEEQAAKEKAEADAKAEKERADELQREKDAEATAAGKDKLKMLATAIGANEIGATTEPDMTELQNRTRHFRAGGTDNANFAKPKEDVKDTDDPHAISGWHSSSYKHSPQGSSTDAASYNNKEPAMDVLFSAWVGVVPVTGIYTLITDTHRKHVSIPGMPTHSTHQPVPIGVDSGERGTLNGVPGRFRATGSVVQLMVDPDGAPTWDGTLTFEPDNPIAMVSQEDQSYMSLGWWLTEQDSDGALTVEVAAWGSQTYSASDTDHGNSLTGKAEFKGIAVGKYTHKDVNDISGGHFNADATLEADFADSSTGGSLTGTIDNFEQDGVSIGQGWKVVLKDLTEDTGNIGTGFAVAAAANSATGTFGRHETDGSWQARFVGDGRTDPMPEGVVGEFHIGALGDPINMVGAFAASNMEADQVDRP